MNNNKFIIYNYAHKFAVIYGIFISTKKAFLVLGQEFFVELDNN
jgi:hypothetical protein